MFCDDIELYKTDGIQATTYPWNILLSGAPDAVGLQQIIDDNTLETRAKILAYRQLFSIGYSIEKKELLAVIVEVGLDAGLDVVASFKDGTARYINQTGKMIIWETAEETAAALTEELFTNCLPIIKQTGAWDKPRRPYPANGIARITFLVSDGLYFGEAPINVLFNDSLAKPALLSATALMQFLTERVLATASN
ncbi:MAG: hypothetical protein ABIQ88_23455 [Chitinophagaceae bacterium]